MRALTGVTTKIRLGIFSAPPMSTLGGEGPLACHRRSFRLVIIVNAECRLVNKSRDLSLIDPFENFIVMWAI
jgi:hypothetical protein